MTPVDARRLRRSVRFVIGLVVAGAVGWMFLAYDLDGIHPDFDALEPDVPAGSRVLAEVDCRRRFQQIVGGEWANETTIDRGLPGDRLDLDRPEGEIE